MVKKPTYEELAQRVKDLEKEIENFKHIDETMHDKKERLSLALEASSAGMWDFNPHTFSDTHYNDRWFTMLGYEPDELPHTVETWTKLLHPEDLQSTLAKLKDHIEKKSPYVTEFRMKTKDGNYRWIYSVGEIVSWDIKGNPQRMVGIHIDIDSHIQLEEMLRRSEASLAAAQRVANIGSWDWDIVNDKATWSDEMFRIFGQIPQEFEANYENLVNSVHPDDREFVKESVVKSLKGNFFDINHRIIQSSGEERFVRAQGQVFFDDSGRPVRMIGTCQDVTKLKQTQDMLQTIMDEQTLLLATMPVMVFWTDREGKFVRVNDSFAAMICKSPDEIKGRSLFDLYPETMAKNFFDDNAAVMESGIPKMGIEECVETPTGTIWVKTDKVPLLNQDGEILGIIGFSSDITDLKLLEMELREIKERLELRVIEHTEDLLKTNEQLREEIDKRKRLDEDRIVLLKTIETAREAMNVTSVNGIIIYANPGMENLFGYEKGELLGKSPSVLNAGEYPEKTMADIMEAIEKNDFWEGEIHNKRKDGREFISYATISAFRDEHGKIINFLSTQHDTIEDKKIKEALMRSKEELYVRNKIAEIFLTTKDDKLYGDILEIVLEAMRSPYGTFAYINEDGERVVPSMTEDIWDKCKIPGKTPVFPRETWGKNLWARCIIEKKIISSNGPFKVPDGHIPIFRALAVPVIHQKEVIGNLMVANKDTDYDRNDSKLLQTMADHIAPILHSKLANERYIKDIRSVQDQLTSSLKEKDMLLREIHHRIKNNMQVISSLLRLQSMNIKDRKYADMFKESLNRIKSMALIHEKLYQSHNFISINLNEYLNSLISNILQSYMVETKRIKIKKEIKNFQIDLEKAVPCGLIVNELFSNALKHAFPDEREGQIEMVFSSNDENEIEILISDDGIGLPDDLDITHTESLGMNIVKLLVIDQLNGKIDIDRKAGTKFHIRFKN